MLNSTLRIIQIKKIWENTQGEGGTERKDKKRASLNKESSLRTHQNAQGRQPQELILRKAKHFEQGYQMDAWKDQKNVT